MRIVILGADGFIGLHIALAARTAGHSVLAVARRTARLEGLGFDTLSVDFFDARCHDPEFWRTPLSGADALVNTAGLLAASEAKMRAVHQLAPAAVLGALPTSGRCVLISAVGIEADSTFAFWRRIGEDVLAATNHQSTSLRAGLVLADGSYGGSSLARALAAFPAVLPVVGDGNQALNPIHADDLAQAVLALLGADDPPDLVEIGGSETVTQKQMIGAMRRWLGLRNARSMRVPRWLGQTVGRIGDWMRLGPISSQSVAQLSCNLLAKSPASAPWPSPRGFTEFLFARPASTQDLWHARLYLIRPAIRIVLAVLWLASGLLGLLMPAEPALAAFSGAPVSDPVLLAMARLGGVFDLAIAACLLRGWHLPQVALVQIALVAGYTVMLTLLAPHLWLDPFGGLLKNLPILALIWVHRVLEVER